MTPTPSSSPDEAARSDSHTATPADALREKTQQCEQLQQQLQETLQLLEATRCELEKTQQERDRLQQENARQREQLEAYEETVQEQQHSLDRLEHRVVLLNRQVYGSRQERFDSNQLPLFEAGEETGEQEAEPAGVESGVNCSANNSQTKPRKKPNRSKQPGHGRNPLPENLERRREVYEVADDERRCSCCGEMRDCIGEETSEQLEYQPAQLFVKVHVRKKYACRRCEKHGCEETAETAQSAEGTVNESGATESDANKTDANKTDANKTDANKTDANKTDANKTDANKGEPFATSPQDSCTDDPCSTHSSASTSSDSDPSVCSTNASTSSPSNHQPCPNSSFHTTACANPIGSGTAHIIIASKTAQPISKGLPGPALLAHVVLSKFGDHLPLYRQEDILMRHGVRIRRSTLCGWVQAAANLAQPLQDRSKTELFLSRAVQTDDTPVKFVSENGSQTARLWPYLGDAAHPVVVYDFTTDRTYAGPIDFMKGYKGYLQGDAYGAYEAINVESSGDIIIAGCWAHSRRKFHEAIHNDSPRAHCAAAYIKQLYTIERELKEVSEEQRLEQRQQRSLPIINEFFDWVETERGLVLPKSAIGEALGYAWNQQQALRVYASTGFIKIDNNDDEQMVKPVTLGRKNWLFFGSEAGGKWAAILLGLIMSCKRNLVEPLAYLTDIFRRLPSMNKSDKAALDRLLPHRWIEDHPEHRWEIAEIRRREREAEALRRAERKGKSDDEAL